MLNAQGHEVLDQTPVARPLNFRPPPTLQETIRQFIRTELSRSASNEGQETFEEADDFDVGDDYDPTSPWELDDDQAVYQPEPAPATAAGPGSNPAGETVNPDPAPAAPAPAPGSPSQAAPGALS